MDGKRIVGGCRLKFHEAPVHSIGVEIGADMIDADFSGKVLNSCGALIVSSFLSRCKYVDCSSSLQPHMTSNPTQGDESSARW